MQLKQRQESETMILVRLGEILDEGQLGELLDDRRQALRELAWIPMGGRGHNTRVQSPLARFSR
jgi:hypothetical protein